MSQIIAFAGKKSSGKTTAVNYLLGLTMLNLGVVRQKMKINDKGELQISDLLGQEDCRGVFDIYRSNPTLDEFKKQYLDPYLKIYSFADLLKNEVCIKILGLTHEQCYGTDDDKNSLTELKWQDMPDSNKQRLGFLPWGDPEGFMTAREVMQHVGTNIFRKMYPDVWVDATIRRINEDNTILAVVTDCRFLNEVKAIHKAGGKVIKLLRDPCEEDSHASEKALDDFEGFDAVIDNRHGDITAHCGQIHKVLFDWGLLPALEPME